MRALTAKQKKALKELARIYKIENGHLPDYDDIDYPSLLWIDNMNPCELFYQNAVRFFEDLRQEEE